MAIFGHKWVVLTGFSTQNAILKILRVRNLKCFREIAKFNLAKINPIKVNTPLVKVKVVTMLLPFSLFQTFGQNVVILGPLPSTCST